MMELQGDWFDGKTSAHLAVRLQVNDQGQAQVFSQGDAQLLLQLPFAQLEVSGRIGSTPRYLYFPNGQKLETRDHDAVDALLARHRPSLFNTLAHQLESHLQFVLLTLVLVVGFCWWAIQYGLPLAAKTIAYRLPANVLNMAADETLQLLDKTHFKDSQLDEPTRARILGHFAPAIAEYPQLNIKVQFRAGGDIGANAFALPNGTVVFTDEMVRLAQNDDELLAVLAHEIGHVQYRHALRSTIQGSVLGFGVSMLTGDLSAAGNLLAAMPVLLTTMAYSRDFEREADQNALQFLDSHKIPRHVFVDLMERLAYQAHCDALIAAEESKQPKQQSAKPTAEKNPEGDVAIAAGAGKSEVEENSPEVKAEAARDTPALTAARKARCDKLIAADNDNHLQLLDFFATHPATSERLKAFRE